MKFLCQSARSFVLVFFFQGTFCISPVTSNPNILELHRCGTKFSSSRAVPLGVHILTAEWVKGIQVSVYFFRIMTIDLTQRPSKDTTVISVGQKLHSEIQNTSLNMFILWEALNFLQHVDHTRTLFLTSVSLIPQKKKIWNLVNVHLFYFQWQPKGFCYLHVNVRFGTLLQVPWKDSVSFRSTQF